MTESEIGHIINMLVEGKKSFTIEWRENYTFFDCYDADLVVSGSNLEAVLAEVKELYVSH